MILAPEARSRIDRSLFPVFSGVYACQAIPSGTQSSIRRAPLDAKRGKIFTRLIKELTVAARERRRRRRHEPAPAHDRRRGQGRTTCRARTSSARSAAARARSRASSYEEIIYEGYGPGGVALHHPDADRQQEPHGRRDPPHARQVQRQPGGREQRRLDVLAARARSSSRRRRSTRRSSSTPRSRPAPTT